MKLSPSATLAVILAAGMAAPAAAQTAPANPGWNPRHPQSSYAQPQANAVQPQAGTSAERQNYAQSPTGARAGSIGQNAPAGQTAAYSGEVKEAQQRLHAAGLYNGPQDGLMDPDTRAAIARFQEQHGLRRTEGLDPQTLALLTNREMSGYGSSTPSRAETRPNGSGGYTSAPTTAGGNANASAPRR
jgi:peptidoglycan hydrolase-like protein with peptidoglycan-binding domain